MIVIEEFFSLCRHFRWLSLEVQEHVNLMAAMQMRNVRPKKIRCFLLGLKNGLDRLLNTLFPSER